MGRRSAGVGFAKRPSFVLDLVAHCLDNDTFCETFDAATALHRVVVGWKIGIHIISA